MNNEEKILAMLERHEKVLGDICAEMGSIRTELTRVAVTQENIVLPRLQLLAEGHEIIQEQIRGLSVIDRMQDDISTLKSAMRYLSGELERLKDAM